MTATFARTATPVPGPIPRRRFKVVIRKNCDGGLTMLNLPLRIQLDSLARLYSRNSRAARPVYSLITHSRNRHVRQFSFRLHPRGSPSGLRSTLDRPAFDLRSFSPDYCPKIPWQKAESRLRTHPCTPKAAKRLPGPQTAALYHQMYAPFRRRQTAQGSPPAWTLRPRRGGLEKAIIALDRGTSRQQTQTGHFVSPCRRSNILI